MSDKLEKLKSVKSNFVSDSINISCLLSNIYLNWMRGQDEDSSADLKKVNDLLKNIIIDDKQYWQAIYHNISGLISMSNYNYSRGKNSFEEAIYLRIQSQDKFGKGDSYFNLGEYYLKIGDFEQSEKYFQLTIEIYNKINNNFGLLLPMIQLTENFRLRSNLTEAKILAEKTYEQLNYNKKLDPRPPYEAYVLHRIGRVYRDMNENEKAIEKFKEALLMRENASDIEKIESLSDIIDFGFSTRNSINIDFNYYEERLKNINPDTKTAEIKRLIALGRLSLNKKNLRDLVEAYEIFNKLIHEQNIGIFERSQIIINFIELKLYEKKAIPESVDYSELQNYLKKIEEISSEYGLLFLKIEALILSSKIYLLDFNLENSKNQLDLALNMAENAKLIHLIERINQLKFKNKCLFDIITKNSLDGLQSVSDLVDNIEIFDYLKDVEKFLNR